jgi:threonine/homoserine/homoserine lactone efflux protein
VSWITHFAAFLAVAAVVIVTPGQDTALTIRNTLLSGRRGGVFTAVGVIAGQLTGTVGRAQGLRLCCSRRSPRSSP